MRIYEKHDVLLSVEVADANLALKYQLGIGVLR
jgi:hypothetical protein